MTPSSRQRKRVACALKLFDLANEGLRVTVVLEAVRARLRVALLRLPRQVNLAVAEDKVCAAPRVHDEPVIVVLVAGPVAVAALRLDGDKGVLLAQVVARVGALKGGVDDGADLGCRRWLLERDAEALAGGVAVGDDAGDEGEHLGAVVGGQGPLGRAIDGVGVQVVHVAEGQVDVGVELVSAKERRGALVALYIVLLGRRKVVRVAVGRAAENDDGVLDKGRGFLGDGLAPATAAHGGGLARADDHDELPNAQHLHVHHVGRPRVWGLDLADVEEDWLGLLAFLLLLVGLSEKARDDPPDGAGTRLARVALGEVKGARPVRGAGGEGVAQGGGTRLGLLAVGQGKVEVAHVVVKVERLDSCSRNGSTGRIERVLGVRSAWLRHD